MDQQKLLEQLATMIAKKDDEITILKNVLKQISKFQEQKSSKTDERELTNLENQINQT